MRVILEGACGDCAWTTLRQIADENKGARGSESGTALRQLGGGGGGRPNVPLASNTCRNNRPRSCF